MAAHDEHLVTGGVAGLAAYAAYKAVTREPWTLGGALLSLALGAGSGLAPDLLEPPTSPTHRGVFHSLGTGVVLAWVGKRVWDSPLDTGVKCGVSVFVAGFLAHLLQDSTTPAGLPLL